MAISEIHSLFLKSTGVCTDTRKMKKDSMFFALKGGNFNGNLYAVQAIEAGASYAIVDEIHEPHERLILVDDVLSSLQDLANYHRNKLEGKVVALTGSNGKTTSKELIHAVLSEKFNCRATAGNFNNHIGVPLTILATPLDTELLVVEMGANHQGEIRQLCEIATPDYGLIVNIGLAHLEGFGGVEGVKKGKTEMYKHLEKTGKQVFFNNDEPSIAEFKDSVRSKILYGKGSEVSLDILSDEGELLQVSLMVKGDSAEVQTQLYGNYNANNVLTAAAIGTYFGVEFTSVIKAIEGYQPSNNRSQLERTKRGNEVIMDAYNANPTSLGNAVNAFATKSTMQDVFILGDMLELGDESGAAHQALLDSLQQCAGVKILVGPEFGQFAKDYDFRFFENVETLVESKILASYSKAKVLVKGSRGIRLEKVLEYL